MAKNQWVIVGASARGLSHIKEDIPCQDSFYYERINDDSGIVALSDGAGSYSNSHLGSSITVNTLVNRAKEIVLLFDSDFFELHAWNDLLWHNTSLKIMLEVRKELLVYSRTADLRMEDLSCTCQLLIYTKNLILFAHVGDGRAGYRDLQNDWHALMTPYSGEEAGSTAFITNNIEKYDLLRSVVVRTPFNAFTMISDGCERITWEIASQTGNDIVITNKPFAKFFDANILYLKAKSNECNEMELNSIWAEYLEGGTGDFANESDDKTIIIGLLNK